MALTPTELALVHETVEQAMADTLPEQVAELRRQRDGLLEALRPFAKHAAIFGEFKHPDSTVNFTIGDCRRAAAAIALCNQTPDPK